MAIDLLSTYHSPNQEEEEEFPEEEEDYIDLEVSSHSIFLSNSFSTPPNHQHSYPSTKEFEFQMFSNSLEREHQPSTSPADELFYKGKLLPLHLPPRLQMVEKLLENSNQLDPKSTLDDFYTTPLATCPSTPIEAYNTPYESCNVSRELNPDEYFFEYPEDESEISSTNPKKSWGVKIKLIKQSLLGSKMKGPKTYLKSFLSKYSCSNESCTSNVHQAFTVKAKNKESKTDQNLCKESEAEKDRHHRRRSFSGLSKRRSVIKTSTFSLSSCSSSSSSSDSSLASNESVGFKQQRFQNISSNRNSEMESPIQGAIKHCKQSQHVGKNVAVFPESV